MKKQHIQYSIGDLTRALIREYLSQKGLKETLEIFEKEDPNNKKKISKSSLIEMTTLKHLCFMNKSSQNPQNTLLDILVAYLNKKYQSKGNHFARTQPQVLLPQREDFIKKVISKPETIELYSSKEKPKQRPSTSKQQKFKTQQLTQKSPQIFEKKDLKVLYQKVSKIQDFKVNKNNQQKMEHNPNIDKPKQVLSIKTSINKYAPVSQIQAIQVQQAYQDQFENQQSNIQKQLEQPKSLFNIKDRKGLESLKDAPSLPIIKQNLVSIQELVNSNANPNQNQTVLQKSSNKQLLRQKEMTSEKQPIKTEIKRQSFKKDPALFSRESEMLEIGGALDSKKKLSKQLKLLNSLSQEKINPLPILHTQQPIIQRQSNKQQLILSNKKYEMGGIVEKQQPKAEPAQESNKTRTQMRILGKGKQSKKQLDAFEIRPLSPLQNQTFQQIEIVKKEKEPENIQISEKQTLVQSSKKQISEKPAPVMVVLGKKKKNKQQISQANYPTKFKFDQNFTHQIPIEIKYEYQPYNFENIVIDEVAKQKYPEIVISTGLNYKQKGGGIVPPKKKQQKMISSKDAQRLKKITFQSGPSILPKAWAQGFILSPFQQTPYGLKQIEGGPCGIIAAVQCYFLKHLLYCSKVSKFNDEVVREVCLVAALTDLLWKIKSADKITLVFPSAGATKVDVNNLRVAVVDAGDFQTAFAGVWSRKEEFIGEKNHGVASLLFSAILTKGIELIETEMDNNQNPLIGNHGHCTQQFVNLIITGKASSNCFDGEKNLDDYKLKGITQKSQYGFLTIFETLKYIEVGKNLKNPVFPIWIICKQFHYHVIFASHYLIAEKNNAQRFDMVYFDGLYNCGDRIRLTLTSISEEEGQNIKLKDLPLIEQVMMTKWGHRRADWNGSTKIL